MGFFFLGISRAWGCWASEDWDEEEEDDELDPFPFPRCELLLLDGAALLLLGCCSASALLS